MGVGALSRGAERSRVGRQIRWVLYVIGQSIYTKRWLRMKQDTAEISKLIFFQNVLKSILRKHSRKEEVSITERIHSDLI